MRQACDMCRQLKAKCDELKPCKSCKEKKVECKYREAVPKQWVPFCPSCQLRRLTPEMQARQDDGGYPGTSFVAAEPIRLV